jgi:hypothetical protein
LYHSAREELSAMNTETSTIDAEQINKRSVNGKRSRDAVLTVWAARVSYAPDSGLFTWTERRGYAAAGSPAGSRGKGGCVLIGAPATGVLAHRLAYFIVNGHCPPMIDHVDRNPSNNAISNLRAATASQNQANAGARADQATGVRGMSLLRNGKSRAQIREGGKVVWLGDFIEPVAAWVARVAAAERVHGHAFMRESAPHGWPDELTHFVGEHIAEHAARQLAPLKAAA